MADKIADQYIEALNESGMLAIPGLIPQSEIGGVQADISEAFEESPYGRDEKTGEIQNESRIVGLGEDVDILSVFQIDSANVKSIVDDSKIKHVMTGLLGEDFYLDRAIVRRARSDSSRFYYHKDQHGDIGLAILLTDLGPDSGATTVLPGRHLGTPLTLFSLNNINDAHPGEIQMTGKAGDAFLFYRDIDHSRAENLAKQDNTQLIFSFVNKNTFPGSHSRSGIKQKSLADCPSDVQHMLRPYDGEPLDENRSFVEKLIYGSGYSSPGAGDYDIRNDLWRDFLYTMFYVRGKKLRKSDRHPLPRNTTRLNEIKKVSLLNYLGQLKWRLVFRNLTLQIMRRSSAGRSLISGLQKFLHSA